MFWKFPGVVIFQGFFGIWHFIRYWAITCRECDIQWYLSNNLCFIQKYSYLAKLLAKLSTHAHFGNRHFLADWEYNLSVGYEKSILWCLLSIFGPLLATQFIRLLIFCGKKNLKKAFGICLPIFWSQIKNSIGNMMLFILMLWEFHGTILKNIGVVIWVKS